MYYTDIIKLLDMKWSKEFQRHNTYTQGTYNIHSVQTESIWLIWWV